jgi:phosphoglycolate phosphatase-like HAD superfamily hydrolase
VLAWREALQRGGIELAVWRIHRRIGMSGGLFVNALLRETGRPAPPQQAEKFQKFHSEAYLKQVQRVQPLPGAKELLKSLTKARVRWAIATSGRIAFARPSLDALEVPSSVPIITRDQVERAKRHCELHRCRRPPWGSACRTEGAGFGSGSFIRRVWAG